MMGSHVNFRNMENSEGRPLGTLARQSSVYSLTLDEFQNSLGGFGKDFGSMNMDEFLKNIWTAEETQAMTTAFGSGEGVPHSGSLQRQGSLTLPRTLSQKTVDEVWKDVFKESVTKDGNSNLGSSFPKSQQTLGEMTLEEFLVRAGVVKEDAQLTGKPSNNGGFYGDLSRSNNNNAGLSHGYPQPGQTNPVVGNGIIEIKNNNDINQIPNQSPKFSMNVNGIRAQQQLFPNQVTAAFGTSIHGGELGNPGLRTGITGMADTSVNNGFGQGGGGLPGGPTLGMVGLGAASVKVATGSPANRLSSDVMRKRDGGTSLSPGPYTFNKGRKCSGAVEKVVERRQRRMIKNRESAARSRARKQAYTMELEAEVAKLKEENQLLQKKQADVLEVQKNRDWAV
ncbi:ABSCISIC ACID-INSENSITIVE 5-like protein 5 isoform X2 [Aristolochia californica]|uniref:ABSCISIC ACID-INSENSITIVE 5-like protein 5 isoform X2 n=1 Tax=Aristolochia californica TaxID=171875 RepID=UPI0035E352D4